MKSKICLIRHGITEGNQRRLYYGVTDIPLADEGVAALKKQVAEGLYIDSENASYFTTGLLRTEQTFQLIYGDKPHEAYTPFREVNFGDFEMLSYEDLKDREDYQKWISGDMIKVGPPGGESSGEFYARVTAGFDEFLRRHLQKVLSMRHQDEEALSVAVCHGGTISVIMEYLYPGVHEHFYQWIPDPGHGYILTLEDGAITSADKF
jgi:alpha-ribazole phosphatase